MRLKYTSIIIASVMAWSPSAWAEDAPPAVSAPNVKADLTAGALGGGPAALAGITGTVPLGHSFGLQADAAFGVADADERGGVAGHLFYRDPRTMLLGVTGMWSKIAGPHDDAESKIRRVGVESEFYMDDVSVLPAAGIQNSHGDSTGYASLAGIYYASPSLALASSVSGFGNSRALQAGLEYQPDPGSSLSYLADAGISNQGPAFVMVGVRFSFGAGARTLKERDRFDDPANIVTYMNTTGAAALTAKTAHNPAPVVAAPAPEPDL